MKMKLKFIKQVETKMTWVNGMVERVAGWSIRRKMDIVLFLGLVLFPLALLLVGYSQDQSSLLNFTVGFLTLSVILFIPISRGLSLLMAEHSIRKLNDQCYRLKRGDYSLDVLPPEQGEEHDFMRLRRNLHWMGYAIATREQKLASAIDKLAETQHQILESIEYASLIQTSFLPDVGKFSDIFSSHFLLWSQRDRVGGDSCWVKRYGSGFFVAVIDCTGHGVPGAFMTLIVQSMLERAVFEANSAKPSEVLARLNCLIKDALGQNDGTSRSDDGLDCALCFIEPDRSRLFFSGANRPLFIMENHQIRTLKGDRCGIGYVRSPKAFAFTDHEVSLRPGMRFFLTTDGVTDQVGGPRGLPFGKSRLLAFLLEHADNTLEGQDIPLRKTLEDYRGEEPRRDDVTVLGFEI
ncbi:PP2C family protein-serine/threonine phosphatase [Pseudodesulfovibrio tunisiensis]|uniref:PP2C family protein-serine/threonine phosphatase n=1 Tax=Pseudodesulfovibrio tunisiensis TaxID=463192 RepID=UPI001FB28A61|nr:PP2C family protein-serine/threonine phosphatase [Pseudodesulfovibrio tunisiensis]